jgi:mitochondrial splicing suppressor protein 51
MCLLAMFASVLIFDYLLGAQGFDEAINMANWDVFFYTRSFPSMDSDRNMRHVSKLLTYPITIGSVLHESSPYKKQVTPEGLRSLAGN